MKRSFVNFGRVAIAGAVLVVATGDAFATGGSLAPVQTTLQTLVTSLTGPIATSLAILAVIACGFLAWAGRLTWGVAGSVILGIVLVFGSAQIVGFFQNAASSGG